METNPEYPSQMIRGIKKEEWASNTPPYASAFFFDKNPRKTDSKREMSIYWDVDAGALELLKNQRNKDGALLFHAGYALIDRSYIDILGKKHSISYEWHRTRNNPYHGNILVNCAISPIDERLIAAKIAMNSRIFPIYSTPYAALDTVNP